MELSTTRLRLGLHRPDTVEALHRWRNDPEIADLSSDSPLVENSLEGTRSKIERWNTPRDEQIDFAIYLDKGATYIGFCHIALIDRMNHNCRIGLVIGDSENWGSGYGTEALKRLSSFCFEELAMHRITCEAFSHNLRAWRMLEAAGFTREGALREQILRGDNWHDEYVYGLLKQDVGSK